jgi:hypothetical protein
MSIEIFQEQDRILHQISKEEYEGIITLYQSDLQNAGACKYLF